MSDSTSKPAPEEGVDSGRREFVRKAAYTAPTLVVLGLAAHSDRAHGQFPPPPSAPSTNSAEEPISEEDVLEEEWSRSD